VLQKKASQAKSGTAPATSPTPSVTPNPQAAQQPLNVDKSSTTLPERKPPVKIPGPSDTPAPTGGTQTQPTQ